MTRSITTAAAFLLITGAAYAAPYQATVTARDASALQMKIVAAAQKVCQAARAHDLDGEFGNQAECVANTLSMTGPARALPTSISAR